MPARRTTVREVDFDSPAYHAACEARDRILRQPLGLRLSAADVAGESVQRHFILELDGEPLGGVIAKAAGPKVVQLRQMWIEPDAHGRGLGKRLLSEVSKGLAAEGIRHLVLHARLPVLGFYEKCGFLAKGPEFSEIGIPHRRMSRTLGPPLSPERRSPDCRR